jgi:hypothetical protein
MSQQLRDWAKQALEMLNDNHHLVADNEKHAYVMMHLEVIERGKALLEQPEPVQEPVALKPCRSPYCECADGKCTHPGCYDARQEEFTFPAQPAPVQEPYCYVYIEDGEEYFAPKGAYVPDNAQPLYTTPPAQPAVLSLEDSLKVTKVCCGDYANCHAPCTPRGRWQAHQEPAAWVGLTDDDIAEAGQLNLEGPRMLPYSFARAIEAKLREKNGGAA